MKRLQVSIADQTLRLLEDGQTLAAYAVSTALKGPGEQSGSEQTPRGAHIVRSPTAHREAETAKAHRG